MKTVSFFDRQCKSVPLWIERETPEKNICMQSHSPYIECVPQDISVRCAVDNLSGQKISILYRGKTICREIFLKNFDCFRTYGDRCIIAGNDFDWFFLSDHLSKLFLAEDIIVSDKLSCITGSRLRI